MSALIIRNSQSPEGAKEILAQPSNLGLTRTSSHLISTERPTVMRRAFEPCWSPWAVEALASGAMLWRRPSRQDVSQPSGVRGLGPESWRASSPDPLSGPWKSQSLEVGHEQARCRTHRATARNQIGARIADRADLPLGSGPSDRPACLRLGHSRLHTRRKAGTQATHGGVRPPDARSGAADHHLCQRG
jgi:hypothetical protein